MTLGPAEAAQGPMLLGSFVGLILYGISFTQVYLYWATYWKKDRSLVKRYVALVFLVDTGHIIVEMAYLYLSLIKHFGDTTYILKSTWLLDSEIAFVGIIGGLVQAFYGWRLKILVGSWLLSGTVFLGASLNMLLGIGTAIAGQRVRLFLEFRQFQVVVIIWASIAIITDLVIMITLVMYLRRSRTGFKSTDTHIDRIIRLTLQTGMITVIWDISHLLTYEIDPAGIHLFFNFTLGRLYSNAFLSSLNSRGGWEFIENDEANQNDQQVEVSLHNLPEVFVEVETHATVDTTIRKPDAAMSF
ncbi:hypothetical protein GYMLUDRAFT_88486 [Collybiopsis luxurians FD-317 M1]|uniref:Unplaced genomic scaffold GYMLUscaffold_85, whole genome shotgun sequence n=1 Tax=Collybiopsis luxurians FD-317 M1 TaxID=944289 RepID=A0A0D0BEQ6_9AGAR|nr:hypothetical protein GYMLUDRAFT_88486 [Collybiopsis luxurians FD-317 M1]